VCAKLSPGEAKVFGLLLDAVNLERRARGETAKVTPSALLRQLVLAEAHTRGVMNAPLDTTPAATTDTTTEAHHG
jgi:hypothetical protein